MISENIANLRKIKKMTQKELAEKIGKSEIAVRKYESGDINVPTEVLKKIADVLEVYIGDLMDASKDKVSIGENIIRVRKSKGISQEELSKKANISRTTLWDCENNIRNPVTKTLIKISDALDCTLSELIGDSDENTTQVKIDNLQALINETENELLKPKYSNTLQYDKGFLDGLKIALQIIKSEECEI